MADLPPHRFAFEFSAGRDLTVYWFALIGEIDRARRMTEDSDGAFQARTEELEEEYGVHDFATSGEHEVAGFHSYEVEPERWPELIGKWRDFFTSQNIGVGEIVRMSRCEYERRFNP